MKKYLRLFSLALFCVSAESIGAQPAVGKSCIVLVGPAPSFPRVEQVAKAVMALRKQAHLSAAQLPVAILSWSVPAQQSMVVRLGFSMEDLPLATTGQVDASHLPISANLHRPPLTLSPNIVAHYLLNEWARREKDPPTVPAFPYPAAAQEKPGARPGKRTNERDGSEMVYVSAGSFWRGSCEGELDELPPQLVEERGFYMAQNEVTVAQFTKFVEATQYQTTAEKEGSSWLWSDGEWDKVPGANWKCPSGSGSSAQGGRPVCHISKADAAAYCEWAGVRLPREDEWEKAARGPAGRRYPWGDKWPGAANRNALASPYGCLAMGSGVREWTDTLFRTYHPDIVIKEPRAGRFVVRGGGDKDGARECRTSYRFTALPESRSDQLGFRVVWDGNGKLGLNLPR